MIRHHSNSVLLFFLIRRSASAFYSGESFAGQLTDFLGCNPWAIPYMYGMHLHRASHFTGFCLGDISGGLFAFLIVLFLSKNQFSMFSFVGRTTR